MDQVTTRKPSELGLGAAIRHLHRAYIRRLNDRLASRRFSVAHYLHLRVLWEADSGLTQTEISQYLGIEKASSTIVLNFLERKGYIQKVRDSADRRRLVITLTKQGRALRSDLMPFAKQIAIIARRNLPSEEVNIFLSVLDRMVENLDPMEKP